MLLDGSPGAEGDSSVRPPSIVDDGGVRSTDSAPEPCSPRDTDSAPKDVSYPTKLSGRDAWIHDEKSPAGYFHTFDALQLGTGVEGAARKIHVFLPRSYTTGCTRYPVVYMNDGDTAFFAGAVGKSWDMQTVLAEGYAARQLPEMIVVAVHPLEREREYTHTSWLPSQACCGLPLYVDYLSGALKPFIDGAYRTRSGPADNVILGSSHGGLASFYTAALRSEVFGKVIGMSSSFWVGLDSGIAVGGPLDTSDLMRTLAPKLLARRPRVYLDWGLVRTGGANNAVIEDRATVRGREMSSLLVASYGYTKNNDLFTVEDAQGEHDELSWRRRVGNALKVMLGP